MNNHSVSTTRLFRVVTSLVLFFLTNAALGAAPYPERPIRLVISFTAGATTDIVGRSLGQQLSRQMGQPVVIENRTGAGGNIGAAYVAKAAPDGYTLLLSVIGIMAINPSLYKVMPFDSIKDFATISQVTSVPQVMLVSPTIPVKNLKEFIVYAKARAGQLNYASGGVGTATHLAGELFNAMAGTNLLHVPYKGSAPAMIDVLGGSASLIFDPMPTALPIARSARLKPLGVTSAERSPSAPDIPTISEEGLPGYNITIWHGLVAPAGTPVEIINRLHVEVVKALEEPALRKSFLADGIVPVSSTPEQFAAFTKAELERWTKVIKESGIQAAD